MSGECVSIDVMLFFFFFFQAEDGIRDLVRSRGLGDVYKRQHADVAGDRSAGSFYLLARGLLDQSGDQGGCGHRPVSYTHLTLPTIYSV